MRHFGTDAPEYFCFQIGEAETVYKIPLAASLSVKVLTEMHEAEQRGELFTFQLELLRKYIGHDIDEMSVGTVTDILRAWLLDSDSAGASVGESSASSE